MRASSRRRLSHQGAKLQAASTCSALPCPRQPRLRATPQPRPDRSSKVGKTLAKASPAISGRPRSLQALEIAWRRDASSCTGGIRGRGGAVRFHD